MFPISQFQFQMLLQLYHHTVTYRLYVSDLWSSNYNYYYDRGLFKIVMVAISVRFWHASFMREDYWILESYFIAFKVQRDPYQHNNVQAQHYKAQSNEWFRSRP